MTTLLPPRVYFGLLALLSLAYIPGLFVLLMDNDSAHHANIALHMYLTGDYVSLVSDDGEYLDKPHFLFWTTALSYHLFGVTSFAYRFPSFFFTILSVWSTYRLGKALYDKTTGELAALMTASAFALILSNVDVRMDAILTGAGVFATWQGIEWLRHKRLFNAFGLALGLAIGFATKGWSGMTAPVAALIFYTLATRTFRNLLHPQLGVVFLAFLVLIAPVLYCFYLQFDLHPEKIIRGVKGRSGLRFILWEQNFERFQGEAFGRSGSQDRFFFFHTFLWAFAPWSLLAYAALVRRFRYWKERPADWVAAGPFVVMALLISFAGYKLPHYLNVILPFTALLTAAWWLQLKERPKAWLTVQATGAVLLLLSAVLVNTWSFPLTNILALLGLTVFLATAYYLLAHSKPGKPRVVTFSTLSSALVFYLLNTNFYPHLLTYQGGNRLAFATRGKVEPKDVYYWPGVNSSSYNFYACEPRKVFADSLLAQQDTLWILTDRKHLPAIEQQGLRIQEIISSRDFPTDKLKGRFLNPATRDASLDTLMLVRIN